MTPENATLGGAVAGVSELQTFLDTYPCQANANESCKSSLSSRLITPRPGSLRSTWWHGVRCDVTEIDWRCFFLSDYFFFEPFDEPVSYF